MIFPPETSIDHDLSLRTMITIQETDMILDKSLWIIARSSINAQLSRGVLGPLMQHYPQYNTALSNMIANLLATIDNDHYVLAIDAT